MTVAGEYRIYKKGGWPKKKKIFLPYVFPNRGKAVKFCRQVTRGFHPDLFGEELTIVYPDEREESWKHQ
jgi:hypothetical protein